MLWWWWWWWWCWFDASCDKWFKLLLTADIKPDVIGDEPLTADPTESCKLWWLCKWSLAEPLFDELFTKSCKHRPCPSVIFCIFLSILLGFVFSFCSLCLMLHFSQSNDTWKYQRNIFDYTSIFVLLHFNLILELQTKKHIVFIGEAGQIKTKWKQLNKHIMSELLVALWHFIATELRWKKVGNNQCVFCVNWPFGWCVCVCVYLCLYTSSWFDIYFNQPTEIDNCNFVYELCSMVEPFLIPSPNNIIRAHFFPMFWTSFGDTINWVIAFND